MPTVEIRYGGYCQTCDVYGTEDEPCWVCGAVTVTKPVPLTGWRHDEHAS